MNPTSRQIYIIQGQQSVGPFTEQQLAVKLVAGEINESIPSCEPGGSDWVPLSRTLNPVLLQKSLEFRRASGIFTANSGTASFAPSAGPAASASFVDGAEPVRGMPAASLLEPNGTPIPYSSAIQPGTLTSAPVASYAPQAQSMRPAAAAMPSASSAPKAVATSGSTLGVEEIGRESVEGTRRRSKLIFGGVAASIAIAVALLWTPASRWWQARQESARATVALAAGQYEDALVAAHNASSLQPDSAVYLAAWQDIRRQGIERVKAQMTKADPLGHLLYSREYAAKYEKPLAEEGKQTMRDWIAEVEPGATKQIREAFDRDIAFLNALLEPHEGKLAGYFSTDEQRAEAARLHEQWLALREAYVTWDRNEPVKTVAALARVNEDLRRAVYDGMLTKTRALREKLENRLQEATKLADAHRYLETPPIFTELDPYSEWLTNIKMERQRIQMAGENYYASILVEAVRAQKTEAIYSSFKDYMNFRHSPLKDEELRAFLAIRNFRPYLERLTDFGLHPKTSSARQNYADIVLIASNLPNLADRPEAEEFLRGAYFDWARQELDRGRAGPAAYLAQLAAKYDNPAATQLFDKAREKIGIGFTLAVQPVPLVVNAAKASKLFGAQLENDAVAGVHSVLPAWIRWQPAGAPPAAGEPEPLIVVKLVPVLVDFNRRNEVNRRNVKDTFRFEDLIVENPEWGRAQEALVDAQNRLAQAQSDYQQMQALAQVNAQNAASAGGWLGALSAVVSGVGQGVSQAAVTSAQQELNEAQAHLAATPRQLRKENKQTVSWTETDYISNFDAQFRLDLMVGDKLVSTRKFVASATDQSTERESAYGGRVSPLQRREPSIDEIETTLVHQIKERLAVVGTPEYLREIKDSLGRYVAEQSAGMDPETRANTQLGLEMLWWGHPLFNRQAMATPDLLGRFGDVIEIKP